MTALNSPRISWERRLANELGLPPAEEYGLGMLRFSRVDNHPDSPALVLEIREEPGKKVVMRRLESTGGFGTPRRILKASERARSADFQQLAFEVLDRLTDPSERRAISKAGPEANVQGCTIDGRLIAVQVETRDELPISLTRRTACRPSVMRARDGIYGKITYEDVLPRDAILDIEPVFEAMMAEK